MIANTRIRSAGWLLFAGLALAACSDSDNCDTGLDKSIVSGTVFSVLEDKVSPNRDFQVLDLEKSGEEQVIAEGKSNASGEFAFPAGTSVALIVLFDKVGGEPRSSGLVSLAEGPAAKSLDAVTDIACQAGASAVGDGSLGPLDITAERIANLEAGAAQVLAAGGVDFTDDASVAAAADQVRALTNDGANEPG